MRRMAYPASFMVAVFAVILTMLFSVMFVGISFSYINNLQGWSYYQIIAVVGSYMIVEGAMWGFFGQLNAINMHIRDGMLDGILLKPVDDQFLISFWRGELEDLARIFSGFVLLVISIKNTIGISFDNLFLFSILLFCAVMFLYSFNLMIRSISFWLIDGSSLWLLMERITSNSQFPIDIYYHRFVRNFLTFVIPLAFIATIPAKILTNAVIDYKLVSISLFMCFVFFSVSRKFWKFALKHYSSASS